MSQTSETVADTGGDLEILRALYTSMTRVREFEQTAGRLMAAGRLPGFIHLSLGQEAVAAGVCGVLRRTDLITTTHRGHGHCLAKGATLQGMMAELFGVSSGYGGGRSGSMHMADPVLGILGANAIVAAGLPIALGGALASALAGRGDVAVAFFGEGAVAEGLFHETLNIAALWKLPLVFVCENNQYAEMSHISVHLANVKIAGYADNYGVPGRLVDGNDAILVREAMTGAVDRARAGHGPTLLECATYRWQGHYEGDPQRYRDRGEVARWRTQDPLLRLRARWLTAGGDPEVLDALDVEAAQEVDDAVAAVDGGPRPGVKQLMDHVYIEERAHHLAATHISAEPRASK